MNRVTRSVWRQRPLSLSSRCAALVALSLASTASCYPSTLGSSSSVAASTWTSGGSPFTTCASDIPGHNQAQRKSLLASFSTSSDNDTTMTTTTDNKSSLTVVQLPCLSDNYGYLLHDESSGATAAIDTPDAKPYLTELQRRQWTLTHIFNTHHHWDHTGGNQELIEAYKDVAVVGPANEKIPGRTTAVNGGDEVNFGSTKAQVLDVGGHTKGHVAYHFANEHKVFVGDALFALGCGKMFEGTPTQFWDSLQRLRALDDDTLVYCAHEYTASNAKFAASVEPNNDLLMKRVQEIQQLRKDGKPTVPSLLGVEKQTNPFLRCDISPEIRSNVGVVESDSDAQAFAKVRSAKDNF